MKACFARASSLAGLAAALLVTGCGSNEGAPQVAAGGPSANAGSAGITASAGLGQANGGATSGGQGGASNGASGAPDIAVDWLPDPASHVDTLIGTTNRGNVFPGAVYPFGMMQWSPDTPRRPSGGGYDYQDKSLLGFSLTHISGPGCSGAMGDVPILPWVGNAPSGDLNAVTQPFEHTGEVATAGYYSVQLGSPAVKTELTATLHSAMARFTFPSSKDAHLLFKLQNSAAGNFGDATATVVGDRELRGSTISGNFCGTGIHYTLYFDIVFDRSFTSSKILPASGKATPGFALLTFDASAQPVLQAKVAISFVSTDAARANWLAENPEAQWSFDTVKSAAVAKWNDVLGRVQIAGGTETEQRSFYTALYHSLLHPNVATDVDGQYVGFDKQLHRVSGMQHEQYVNYSGWDIYHTQVQLSALVAPEAMSDSAQSMLNDAAQNNGALPKWSLVHGENNIMVGDPADGIIAGYYAFGARRFDSKTALQVMLKQATVPGPMRPGLSEIDTLGYVPDDCCQFYQSVGVSLEYAQADFALSRFASALGDTVNAAKLLKRSQNWQNLFNPAVGMFNPRLRNGTFLAGQRPTSNQGMAEGSAQQYRWVISFNRRAQLAALGGAATVNPALDAFFSQLNDPSGVHALMANEFELGAPYWSNYTGQPWKTQEIVNRIRSELYRVEPSYIPDNDDLGSMSSALVWYFLGVYPAHPGSAELAIGGPAFEHARVHLPSGATLTLHATGASKAAPYIQGLKVNGVPSNRAWLEPSFIESGGVLEFEMGSTPNPAWASAANDAPPSYGSDFTSAVGFASPNPLVLTPGAKAELELGAQSLLGTAQDIGWSFAAAPGFSLSSGSGTLTLAPGARSSAKLEVTAPTTLGAQVLGLQLTSSTGATPPTLGLPVFVANAGSIAPYLNNTGSSADGIESGDFDGGGASYSSTALAAQGVKPGGTLTSGGVSYHFPSGGFGRFDNINVGGQVISYPSVTGKKKLALLGSAANANGAGATGTLVVTYADKSTQNITIRFSDWTRNAGGSAVADGNAIVVTCPYRKTGSSKNDVPVYLFSFSATLSSTQPVVSLGLPQTTQSGDIHLFAIELI